MTYRKIIEDLKKKKFAPVYLLTGDEPYYIDLITDYIEENALPESEKSFNQIILYGADTDIGTVINTAKRFPMMAPYQVVIIKEAQNIKNFDNLVYYTDNPLKSTILVVCYKHKKLDKRKKLYLSISKSGIVFDSMRLYENQIPDWITNYLREKKYTIKPKAALLLTEFLGNELSKIANELEKLIITLPKEEKEINSEHIEKNIGISKEYNNFELQKALIEKDILKANRIINYFDKNPKSNPLLMTLALLFSFFCKIMIIHKLQDKSTQSILAALKINKFFLSDYQKAIKQYDIEKTKRIISYLRDTDAKSKGVGNVSISDGYLLKELVYKILH